MIALTQIPGIGRATLEKLRRLGIDSTQDLLLHFPRRYDDFSNISNVDELKPGKVSIKVTLRSVKGRYVRRGLHITNATAHDETGAVKIVWFNQPYIAKTIQVGQVYYLSGEYNFERQNYQITNPSLEKVTSDRLQAARVLPIYPETKGLTSRQLRRFIAYALKTTPTLPEDVPDDITAAYSPLSYMEAVQLIHQPDDIETAEAARERLALGELICVSLAGIEGQTERLGMKAVPVRFHEKETKAFVDSLAFRLTDDQRRASWDVLQDLGREYPMNRLLDGDVGSGKTLVAMLAAMNAVLSQKQVAVVAPTTILAMQHYTNFASLLGGEAKISLLTSEQTTAEKKQRKQLLEAGEIDIIIGTHALFEKDVVFRNLALIVIDEQQRFGVEQRRAMQKRLGLMPHVLSMSATPIPRTLALTLYGELDISLIKTMPEGRKPITTDLFAASARRQIDERLETQLKQGKQVYIVTPLIEDSDMLPATSLEQAHDHYSKRFKDYRVEQLHGKMKDDAKTGIMQRFKDGKIDIIVSTTVIEVGVDVANATVMVIESAERFGLAQLHQLRGRVGRGADKSYCFMVTSGAQRPPKRLRAVQQTNSGFELAELDLELRGAGAIYGTRQSGALDLHIATLSDVHLVKKARKAALTFHKTGRDLLQYPQMAASVARFKAITNLN